AALAKAAAPVVTPAVNNVGVTETSTMAAPVTGNTSQPATAVNQQTAKAQTTTDELPAYIPAPKSLVSDAAASQVATVNANVNSQAVLTSLPKPIETV